MEMNDRRRRCSGIAFVFKGARTRWIAAIHGITGVWLAIGISSRLYLHYPQSTLEVELSVHRITTRSSTSMPSKDTPVTQLMIQLSTITALDQCRSPYVNVLGPGASF